MAEAPNATPSPPDGPGRWLSRGALFFVALAAFMGWAASFVGLHDYGQHQMNGFTTVTAWFIPGAFDGAAFGTSLITYRASINGRSALRGRVLMWVFTAISSGINYIHQPNHTAQLVACGLPMAAVAVFDVLLAQLKADYEARHGKRGFRFRPGLLFLRWLVDKTGTKTAFRTQVMAITVEELVGLGQPPTESSRPPAKTSTTVDQPPRPAPTNDTHTDHNPPHSGSDQATQPIIPAASRPPVGKPLRLPPPMKQAVQRVKAEVAREGRDLTVADVQRVINVDDATADQVVAEATSNNGHALA